MVTRCPFQLPDFVYKGGQTVAQSFMDDRLWLRLSKKSELSDFFNFRSRQLSVGQY